MKTYVVFIIIVFLDEFKIIWNKKKKKNYNTSNRKNSILNTYVLHIFVNYTNISWALTPEGYGRWIFSCLFLIHIFYIFISKIEKSNHLFLRKLTNFFRYFWYIPSPPNENSCLRHWLIYLYYNFVQVCIGQVCYVWNCYIILTIGNKINAQTTT